jgi:glycosyltransferase involved in cell wall biosynthesis
MKILLISPTQTGIGGIAQHVSGLANFLKKNGHEIEIISSENTFTIPIKGLKNPSFMVSSFLKTKFKKNYDIVHAHNIPSTLAMKNIRGKKILTIHGIFSKQINELHGKTATIFSQKYEKHALHWADAITVVSKETLSYYDTINDFKIYQIPNAIEIESLPKNKEKKYEKQLIFAGRLSKEKGVEVLAEICKKLPDDINIIILGSGPDADKIKTIANSKKNIHYLGYLPKERTIPLIRGSDILIQPSLSEGISSTLLESMACKTPIITTNIGGNNELIVDNKTGILIDPGDSNELLKQIIRILNDQNLRDKITRSAYDEVQKYDWSNVGPRYLDLYEKLLK